MAAVLTGRSAPPHWAHEDRPYTVWDLKSLFADVVQRVYRGRASVAPASDAPARLDPTQCFAATDADGRVVGHGGRVVDGVVDAPVWAGDVWALEITLPPEALPKPVTTYVPLPQFPASERDLALMVPEGVSAGSVSKVVREAAGGELGALELFDLYTGEGIPEGSRSIAFRLRFRSSKRTLKEKEVDRAVKTVLRRLEEELGVAARG